MSVGKQDLVEILKDGLTSRISTQLENEIVAELMEGVEGKVRELVRTHTEAITVNHIEVLRDHLNLTEEFRVLFKWDEA